jgi:hypothetical protein
LIIPALLSIQQVLLLTTNPQGVLQTRLSIFASKSKGYITKRSVER